ncbi:hypothetical protein DH2020_003044 [Rehmannia glutinosa]|uniref:phenylalanine--tRNA ligase n=1 Tax=Rehmannia glutinosa TaxID=99300 RepID=A0ABR0XKF2_REHGL
MAEEAVLGYLEKNEEISDSGKFAEEKGISHDEIVNVIKSLNGFRLVDAQDIKRERWMLTQEGDMYAKDGSPEVQLFLAVPPEGITREKLQEKVEPSIYKIGCTQAIKNKWIEMGKLEVSRKVLLSENFAIELKSDLLYFPVECFTEDVQHVDDRVRDLLIQIQNGYSVKKGPEYISKRKKVATDLTRENLQRDDWKEIEFKEYNFLAKGQPTECGCLHPLLKAFGNGKVMQPTTHLLTVASHLTYLPFHGILRKFEEMPTNNFVESSFWNFDALFQPQQHPARDSHDTFFLKEPSTTRSLPEDYVERVKRVHESGGYGSRGYGYEWKREEANKNLLRTHTTAVSSRMLYALAQFSMYGMSREECSCDLGPFAPKRYYSIDRVFRNEAVDRTHLAEFHHIEGLICDCGLTLGHLIGVLHDFFSRLGMSKLKFKPAFNPYTEPSMEIFSYHEGLQKWVEIGNSGMFRPEMLLPMGLPEDVQVIAWGVSLERPTMILYGIDNIRDLFGHKVDLSLIKRNPICRLGL